MIRRCQNADKERLYFIINDAAAAYRGHIPADCYHQPYMPRDELKAEMARLTFYGWEEEGRLVGVMGPGGGQGRYPHPPRLCPARLPRTGHRQQPDQLHYREG